MRSKLKRCVAAVALAALIVATPTAAQARRPASAPRIAFADDYKLRVVTADGREEWTVALTDHAVPTLGWHLLMDPAWSPDGTRIAYGESEGAFWAATHTELGVAKADGTEDRTILSLPGAGVILNVRWSPDGSRLAFVLWTPNPASPVTWSQLGSRWDIYVVNVDGSGLRPLAPAHPAFVQSLEFSPDGTKVAFVSDHEGIGVHTVAVDGPPVPRRVTPLEFSAQDVRWSPDGKRLAFTGQPLVPVDVSAWNHIWLIDTDGSNLRQLPAQTYHPPSWSPDGRSLAYVCVDKCGIATIRADGTGERALTRNFGNDYWPVWSRSGQIAFVREIGSVCCTRTLWVMNADGSKQRRLTEARSVNFNMAWSG